MNILYNIYVKIYPREDTFMGSKKKHSSDTKQYKIKRSIAGSRWNISLDDKTKIQKIILKANIYEL